MRWIVGARACISPGSLTVDNTHDNFYLRVLGLAYADIFAGIAPVAGRIHPAINHLLQRGQGKDLPIFIAISLGTTYGEQDPIFAVDVTRQTHTGLTKLGYNVTYTELPEWGHAYP